MAEVRSSRVAVMGCCPVAATRLTRIVERSTDAASVAADRADVLAGLTESELNPTAVALSLPDPPPHPVDDLPMWPGVEGPARSLERVTKAEGSAEEEAGLRVSRDDLLALCDGSRLAELGLVDPDRLRTRCHYSPAPERPHESLQRTIACEGLREATDTQHASVARAGRQVRA